MKIIIVALKKTLFWSYERGAWQYDALCVLILAFIFFTPNHLFHNGGAAVPPPAPANNTSTEIPKSSSGEDHARVPTDQPRLRSEKAAPAAK